MSSHLTKRVQRTGLFGFRDRLIDIYLTNEKPIILSKVRSLIPTSSGTSVRKRLRELAKKRLVGKTKVYEGEEAIVPGITSNEGLPRVAVKLTRLRLKDLQAFKKERKKHHLYICKRKGHVFRGKLPITGRIPRSPVKLCPYCNYKSLGRKTYHRIFVD